ncbi:hypothetical protein ACHAXR_003057, partial [Thalassiosira sp. AJA248-18]
MITMMMPSPLLTILATALQYCISRGAVHAFAPPSFASSTTTRLRKDNGVVLQKSSINNNDDDGNDEEWRAFRARLVQNGLPSLDNTASSEDAAPNTPSSTRTTSYAHITTPLVEVGSILVSVPTTDLCQALDQQYWHRSVVLITQVSDNVVNGNIFEDVPEEQLAGGNKRGRWSYRGLLLNRCTNLLLEANNENDNNNATAAWEQRQTTTSGNEEEEEQSRWRIQRGGDLLGLDSSTGTTEFVCLTSSEHIRGAASTKLVGNLRCTSLTDAQNLCKNDPTKYKPHDFLTFGGFCSWRPGQLELEMGEGRNEWIVISTDGQSIWDELQSLHTSSSNAYKEMTPSKEELSEDHGGMALSLLEAGTDMWRNLLDKINVSESKATERLSAGQLNFYDQMLEVWAEEYLNVDNKQGDTSILNDSSYQIGAGTLVRATSPPTNDMLIYDAEFIRSLILVLEETPDATVGIILNHPMSAAIECIDGEDPLPLRYGGPIDVPSWKDGSYRDEESDGGDSEGEEMYEGFLDYQSNGVLFDHLVFDDGFSEDFGMEDVDDDDDSSFIWIHRDSALGSKGPNNGGCGTQLGTSNFWLLKEDEALKSIQSGALRLEDTMVFSGVCIWEKGP